MSPKKFEEARSLGSPCLIYDRPYFPKLLGNPNSSNSVAEIALKIVNYPNKTNWNLSDELKVSSVTGGITNKLFRVSNISISYLENPLKSVLVRIFGAEGMINRDIETSAYACLCDANIAYQYLGRFANGRIEGWLDGYLALETPDLSSSSEILGLKISEQVANLHSSFEVPEDLQPYFSLDKPGMWDQLFSWLDQAKKAVTEENFKGGIEDVNNARSLFIENLNVENELYWLKAEVVPCNAEVVFCHNDLLAANIMMKKTDDEMLIQLIDFEYGGTNFAAFDIANHFNEYAGGTEDGIPNYNLFPSREAQLEFIKTYLFQRKKIQSENTADADAIDEKEVNSFTKEVEAFVLVNHLYWGLWAINQAAVEGCDEFNYLLYAKNRFKRYQESKITN